MAGEHWQREVLRGVGCGISQRWWVGKASGNTFLLLLPPLNARLQLQMATVLYENIRIFYIW